MPRVCSVCAIGSNNGPLGYLDWTLWPATSYWDRMNLAMLSDNVLMKTEYTEGVILSKAKDAFVQVQLDGVYDDISHVRIWAGTFGADSNGAFLTVWLSPSPNFTATGTACVRGLNIMFGSDAVAVCPPVVGVQYVTIQRVANSEEHLVVHEMQVYRSSKLHAAKSFCRDPKSEFPGWLHSAWHLPAKAYTRCV